VNALAGFSLVILLVGVVIQLVFGRFIAARGKGWLAFLFGILSLAGIIALVPTIMQGKTIEQSLIPWQTEASFSLYFDGLSCLFALMATGIGSAILFYCIDYMKHEESTTRFYAFMLTFIAGLLVWFLPKIY
jgi:NADH:ubiquinone oxidoreductase subunit 5 (subunit L)/multisubunit Na+/H+ antiporter MnhA subunit